MASNTLVMTANTVHMYAITQTIQNVFNAQCPLWFYQMVVDPRKADTYSLEDYADDVSLANSGTDNAAIFWTSVYGLWLSRAPAAEQMSKQEAYAATLTQTAAMQSAINIVSVVWGETYLHSISMEAYQHLTVIKLWDDVKRTPNPNSLYFLAIQQVIQTLVEKKLVHSSVYPVPQWFEAALVPERRYLSYKRQMEDARRTFRRSYPLPDEADISFMGTRDNFWVDMYEIVGAVIPFGGTNPIPNGSRARGLGASQYAQDKKDIDKVLHFGLTKTFSNALAFVTTYMSNKRMTESLLQAPANVERGSPLSVIKLSSVSYLYFHPSWRAVCPEYANEIAARPDMFPDSPSQAYSPDTVDGSGHAMSIQQQLDACEYGKYDYYFFYPDEQFRFYVTIINSVRENGMSKFMPPPTWFDGYFLQHTSFAEADEHGHYSPEDAAVDEFHAANEREPTYYIYKQQLKIVTRQGLYDGFDTDAWTEFWYNMFMLCYNHRPVLPKRPHKKVTTKQIFKDILHAAEVYTIKGAHALTSVNKFFQKIIIHEAGENLRNVLVESEKEIGKTLDATGISAMMWYVLYAVIAIIVLYFGVQLLIAYIERKERD